MGSICPDLCLFSAEATGLSASKSIPFILMASNCPHRVWYIDFFRQLARMLGLDQTAVWCKRTAESVYIRPPIEQSRLCPCPLCADTDHHSRSLLWPAGSQRSDPLLIKSWSALWERGLEDVPSFNNSANCIKALFTLTGPPLNNSY